LHLLQVLTLELLLALPLSGYLPLRQPLCRRQARQPQLQMQVQVQVQVQAVWHRTAYCFAAASVLAAEAGLVSGAMNGFLLPFPGLPGLSFWNIAEF